MQRMKNPVVIIGILIILSVLGIGTFVFSQKSSELQTENVDTNMENNQTPGTQQKTSASPAMAGSPTRYIEYTKSAFDGAANKRRVLFFYANWCPTCRPADASFQQNKNQIPEDVTVIRVNYNDTDTDAEEKALAQKYSITYQHTFVQIDAQGNEVGTWNGGQIDELLARLQ